MKKKTNRILLFAILALAAISLQSCLKDDKEVFSESSSTRMTKTLELAKTTLINSEHGWLFEMYPEGSQSYGGYVYTLKFGSSNVEVRSELAQDNSVAEKVTSLWSVTNDDGPVITFDSYNELLHHFSTPWQDLGGSGYEAYQGEFEFVIMNITDDLITLKGKKTGNIMYLRKLTVPASDYITAVNNMSAKFIVNGLTSVAGDKTIEASIDNDNRQIEFVTRKTSGAEDENLYASADTTDVAFVFTDKGLRLYKPTEVNGKMLYELSYDEPNMKVKAFNEGSQTMELTCQLPENYLKYEEFAGDYVLRFDIGGRYKCNVTLTPAGDGSTFWLSGLNDKFKVRVDYIRSKGCLQIVAQELKTIYDEGYVMWWCPLSVMGGDKNRYFTWTTSVGMTATWNGVSREKPTLRFADNNRWANYEVVAFFLAVFEGTTPSSDGYSRRRSNYLDPVWNLAGRPAITKDDPDDETQKIKVAQSILEKPYSLVKK
jgi:hypothetical protein